MTAKAPRYPNETPAYRAARDELLQAEIQLRAAVERVAAQRRALPLGGVVPQDYRFEERGQGGVARVVALSELFSEGRDTLFIYSFMYGPNAERPCPLCSAFIDALDRQVRHLTRRIDVAVVARAPIERITAFAEARGWTSARLLSSRGNNYNRHYLSENEAGQQLPMANVFVKRDDGVHHFWGSEMLFAPTLEGADPRHVDVLWPLWNVLDLTPAGRGEGFYPTLD